MPHRLRHVNFLAIDQNSTAIESARQRADSATHKGSIRFVHGDIFDKKFPFVDSFDLIVHRGLEAFVRDRKTLVRRLYELAKPWGYAVNITHTYETQPDTRVVRELNEAADAFIKSLSRRAVIEEYESVGFKLIHEREVPVNDTLRTLVLTGLELTNDQKRTEAGKRS